MSAQETDPTASDFIVQDLGDGEGLDLLDAQGDGLAFGLSIYELRNHLRDMGPETRVWVEGGALGLTRGVRMSPAEAMRLMR